MECAERGGKETVHRRSEEDKSSTIPAIATGPEKSRKTQPYSRKAFPVLPCLPAPLGLLRLVFTRRLSPERKFNREPSSARPPAPRSRRISRPQAGVGYGRISLDTSVGDILRPVTVHSLDTQGVVRVAHSSGGIDSASTSSVSSYSDSASPLQT